MVVRRWNKAKEALKHDTRKELNYAMQDIRQQVVERGWFGRQVTPDHNVHGFYHTDDLTADKKPAPEMVQSPNQELQPSKFEEVYGQDYQPIEPNGPEPEEPERDGFDR